MDTHPNIALGEGDTVIFSSRMIPGNERGILKLQDELARRGCRIMTADDHMVHVSGHPARDELKRLYALVKPKYAVPVHGEWRHLSEHAALAKELGAVPVLVEDGDVLRLSPGKPDVVEGVPTGRLALIASLALAAAVAGCGGNEAVLGVERAIVRLSPNPAAPSVAYFTVTGGPVDDRLIGVSSPVAVRTEIHESMTMNPSTGSGQGMATMKPLGDLKIPALSTTAFKPGGKHLMLFDMNPGIKPGRPITLTFTFSDGRRIDALVPTIAPGAPAPTFKD